MPWPLQQNILQLRRGVIGSLCFQLKERQKLYLHYDLCCVKTYGLWPKQKTCQEEAGYPGKKEGNWGNGNVFFILKRKSPRCVYKKVGTLRDPSSARSRPFWEHSLSPEDREVRRPLWRPLFQIFHNTRNQREWAPSILWRG